MIQTFHVQNYKALRDVTLELTPIHVLIGPNDSGKTSILEAIAALCRSVDLPLERAFAGSWNGTELIWHSAGDPVVRLETDFSPDMPITRYGWECRFAVSGRTARVTEEYVERQNGGRNAFNSFGHNFTRVHHIIRNASPESDASMAAAAEVHSLLSGTQTYRWVPRHLALPVAPDSKRRFRMEPSGFGLALCLDDILSYDRDRFIQLEQRYRSIFPHVRSIKLLQEPAFKAPDDDPQQVLMLQRSDGKGLHFQFEGDATLVPASQVSDGLLLVLAYLTVLYLPEPPRLLLIEEPENGIHPARLEEVLTILKDLIRNQKSTQVILTTHSPFVVSLFQPEEVTLCRKQSDGSIDVRRLSESKPVKEQMDFFTLGEIWTGEGDEALMQKADAPIVTGAGS